MLVANHCLSLAGYGPLSPGWAFGTKRDDADGAGGFAAGSKAVQGCRDKRQRRFPSRSQRPPVGHILRSNNMKNEKAPGRAAGGSSFKTKIKLRHDITKAANLQIFVETCFPKCPCDFVENVDFARPTGADVGKADKETIK